MCRACQVCRDLMGLVCSKFLNTSHRSSLPAAARFIIFKYALSVKNRLEKCQADHDFRFGSHRILLKVSYSLTWWLDSQRLDNSNTVNFKALPEITRTRYARFKLTYERNVYNCQRSFKSREILVIPYTHVLATAI